MTRCPSFLSPAELTVNVLFASSEAVPFAKTGGLADVSGSLPVALRQHGVDTSLFLPAYRCVYQSGQPIERTGIYFDIPIGSKLVSGHLLRSTLPGSDVPVYLVDQPQYYDREGLYNEQGRDYNDNCERYVFFCRAVVEAIRLLDLPVDVIHANDWQTGLIPALLATEYHSADRYRSMTTLFTIHNMAYQGQFWHWDMLLTGLDWKHFNWQQMECHGKLNLLKTGIAFADTISAVSPRYALEIQHEPMGCGLAGVLRDRQEVLKGVINGIDNQAWNPGDDASLVTPYDVTTWRTGKAANKQFLQQKFGLEQRPDLPLIGSVGRLVSQKGWELILKILPQWLRSQEAQWIVLGTGDPMLERQLRTLAAEFPQRLAVQFAFSDALAHQIEAGSDMFLMPSEYEPCGLNQLYSLRYGSVPVVRETGGLADTITDLDRGTPDAPANGFSFAPWDPNYLNRTLQRAVQVYRESPETWARLVETGMRQDWSWHASAAKYMQLYQSTVARRNQIQASFG